MPTTLHEKTIAAKSVTRTVQTNKTTGDTVVSEVTTNLGSLAAYRVSRSWTNTANYRSLVKSGALLPDQPYSYSEYRLGGGIVSWGGTTSDGTYRTRQEIRRSAETFASTSTTLSDPGLRAQAIARLHDKVRGSEWNAPVFLAEAGKTSQMVANRASHLVRLLRSLRKGDYRSFVNGLRNVDERHAKRYERRFNKDHNHSPTRASANAWLEFTYGWTPFMLDVKNASELMLDLAEEPASQIGRAVASAKSSSFRKDPDVNAGFPALTSTVYTTVDESRRFTWLFRPKAGYIPSRFGLTNPATVLWELLPFSFVADWFVPVGDYLGQLDLPFAVDHIGGSEGYRRIARITKTIRRVPGFASVDFASGLAKSDIVTVSRSRITSIPSTSFSSLVFKPNVGTTRAISAISLLRQNLSFLDKARRP